MEFEWHVISEDLLERYAAKGHGVITCMAAGNDVLVLGTSKGWVIRHEFGVGDSYDDTVLLRFLQFKFGKVQPGGPDFFYDSKYDLRLRLKEKRMRACVHIYSMMSMHEEAVAPALQEAICSSLQDYNQQTGKLKEEMNDARPGADNIRNDISALTKRYTVIDRDEECGHMLDLQKLTLMGGESKEDVNVGLTREDSITHITPVDKIRSQLDDAIASERPFCGDLIIRGVSLPFILPGEAH